MILYYRYLLFIDRLKMVVDKVSKGKRAFNIQLDKSVVEKYAKGTINFKGRNQKFKSSRLTLLEEQERVRRAAEQTATTEILLPETSGYINLSGDNSSFADKKIYRLKQQDISSNVDLNTARNQLDLQLHNFGPYSINYSRNGRYLLFAGKKGHVSMLDCQDTKIVTEFQLQEAVHDVQFLQNETLFACAQSAYTYIYDSHGVEIHSLRNHDKPYKLDYLPYHYLLVSTGHTGWIRWQDVSTGTYVSGYSTGHGPCNVLRHNPHNAVSHIGHRNGVVSLWSPTAGKPLVSVFCHKSPLTDIAFDRNGTYMATAGYDGLLKIWDLRMFKSVHGYKLDHPALSLDISDTGLLAMGIGRSLQIIKDPFSKPSNTTYLKHEIRTPNAALSSGGSATASARALKSNVQIQSVRFRPLEDVLCAGHSHGISTIIIPGAGEANYDSFENNPFRTLKQRREADIQGLLNKLSPEMIVLDSSFVGTVDKDPKLLQQEHNQLFKTANDNPKAPKSKNKMRGKNKIAKKLRRKAANVVDEQTEKLKLKLAKDKEEKSKLKQKVQEIASTYDPLSRFQRKNQ